jgi:fumarate reductase subunit C
MSTPTTYRQPVSRLWWAKKPTYFLFLLRELSCVFVAWSAVYLMMLVYAIGRDEASYARFLGWASSPVVVVVNVVALAFLVLHTVTWFALTPQAMVVRGPGGRQVVTTRMIPVAGRIVPAATVVRVGGRVPAAMVIASQYLGLAVVSAFIAWLVIR